MGRKLVSLSVFICLLLGMVGLALAKQNKPGFEGKGNSKQVFEVFRHKLDLTADQVTKLKDLMAKHRKDAQLMRSKIDVISAELKVLVQSGDTKPPQYTAKLNELASLKAQIDASNESYIKTVKIILTPVQQAKFELLQGKMFSFEERKRFDKKGFGKNRGNKDCKKGVNKPNFNKDFDKKHFGMSGQFPVQLKKKLGLTDDQVKLLKDEAQKAMDEAKGIQAKLKESLKDLKAMLQDKNTKSEQFTAKLNEINNLKNQLKQSKEKHRKVMAAIFTPEQQAKIELFRMERMQKMAQGFGNTGPGHQKSNKNWHK